MRPLEISPEPYKEHDFTLSCIGLLTEEFALPDSSPKPTVEQLQVSDPRDSLETLSRLVLQPKY